jgi:hypothetical protein
LKGEGSGGEEGAAQRRPAIARRLLGELGGERGKVEAWRLGDEAWQAIVEAWQLGGLAVWGRGLAIWRSRVGA